MPITDTLTDLEIQKKEDIVSVYNVEKKQLHRIEFNVTVPSGSVVLAHPTEYYVKYDEKKRTIKKNEFSQITEANPTRVTHTLVLRLFKADGVEINLTHPVKDTYPLHVHCLYGSTTLEFNQITPFCLVQLNLPPSEYSTSHYLVELYLFSGGIYETTKLAFHFRVCFNSICAHYCQNRKTVPEQPTAPTPVSNPIKNKVCG